MDFGMFTDFHVRPGKTQADAFEESFNQIIRAEHFGMDSVWLAEHHFSPERSVLASPLVIASSIASRTSRIRVGLAVQVLPLTNPLRVAEEAATVDHISKGRFDFGIGRSGLTRYYEGYNVDYAESRDRFFEALDVIMEAWKGEPFTHQGEFYSYQEVVVVPQPYQRPYPPTRIAVASEDTYPRIGEMGHPIFITANTNMAPMKERLKEYRRARAAAGHPGPGEVNMRVPVYVAETTEKAHEEPRESALSQINYSATELSKTARNQEGRENMLRMASVPYQEVLKNRVIFGPPEEVTDRLREFQEELGITGVVLEINYGGLIPTEQVANSVRLLTEKVVPNFK